MKVWNSRTRILPVNKDLLLQVALAFVLLHWYLLQYGSRDKTGLQSKVNPVG